jgi:SAM-dependent methyltransferase
MARNNIDVRAFNREAWNRQVQSGNRWTVPVSAEDMAAARAGEWSLYLTPTIAVPQAWFPEPLKGRQVLCLASGGGQQGPLLAAAGAEVTVYDNSPAQLARDQEVATRERLTLQTVEGDMRRLDAFDAGTFDLIIHPVSNNFVPEVLPVWREAYRVLRPGGSLLAGFGNPVLYIFDFDVLDDEQRLEVRHALPYSDIDELSVERLERFQQEGRPLEFSHTLSDQIGGQILAGFLIAGLYEDHNLPEDHTLLDDLFPGYIATRAIKPPLSPP